MHDIAVSVLIFEAAVCALVIRYRISGNLALHARDVEVEGRAAKRQGCNAVEWVCAVFGDAVNVELHLIGQRVGGGRRTIEVRHACTVFGCPCEAVGDHAVGERRVPEHSMFAHRVGHGESGGYALFDGLEDFVKGINKLSLAVCVVCIARRACYSTAKILANRCIKHFGIFCAKAYGVYSRAALESSCCGSRIIFYIPVFFRRAAIFIRLTISQNDCKFLIALDAVRRCRDKVLCIGKTLLKVCAIATTRSRNVINCGYCLSSLAGTGYVNPVTELCVCITVKCHNLKIPTGIRCFALVAVHKVCRRLLCCRKAGRKIVVLVPVALATMCRTVSAPFHGCGLVDNEHDCGRSGSDLCRRVLNRERHIVYIRRVGSFRFLTVFDICSCCFVCVRLRSSSISVLLPLAVHILAVDNIAVSRQCRERQESEDHADAH